MFVRDVEVPPFICPGHCSQTDTMNADGSDQRNRNDPTTSYEGPVWSPDGTKIVFRRYALPFYDLSGILTDLSGVYVMNADGSHKIQLTSPTGDPGGYDPAWSPDGTKIAFVGTVTEYWPGPPINSHTIYPIYTMNADGSEQTKLATARDRYRALNPAWSPDGTKILFSRAWGDGLQTGR